MSSTTARAAASERGPQPIQNSERLASQMQSPAPSSGTPSGISSTEPIRPRALQRAERGAKHRLLAAPLAMAEARQQRLAVEHDGGVGGEDEIGQVRLRIDQIDLGAGAAQRAVQRRPLPGGARGVRRAVDAPRRRDPSRD